MANTTEQKSNTSSGETFKAGTTVAYSGEYELVDAGGNRTESDIVTLDEGETFPDAENNATYRMVATCFDENCDINVADEDGDIE